MAEEKSLELDHDVCQKARSDLTNPRTRRGAEVMASRRFRHARRPNWSRTCFTTRWPSRESGLPTLAHLNLLAAAFEAVDGNHDADDLAEFIYMRRPTSLKSCPPMRCCATSMRIGRCLVSEMRALDQVEAELTERKRYYRGAIKDALDRLPPMTLVQVMTETVDGVTAGGEDHAPGLIDDLVDSYEVETQGILQQEGENVHKLIKAARDHAGSGDAAVKPYVDKLDAVMPQLGQDRAAHPN